MNSVYTCCVYKHIQVCIHVCACTRVCVYTFACVDVALARLQWASGMQTSRGIVWCDGDDEAMTPSGEKSSEVPLELHSSNGLGCSCAYRFAQVENYKKSKFLNCFSVLMPLRPFLGLRPTFAFWGILRPEGARGACATDLFKLHACQCIACPPFR